MKKKSNKKNKIHYKKKPLLTIPNNSLMKWKKKNINEYQININNTKK
jgi:hypothetical protein